MEEYRAKYWGKVWSSSIIVRQIQFNLIQFVYTDIPYSWGSPALYNEPMFPCFWGNPWDCAMMPQWLKTLAAPFHRIHQGSIPNILTGLLTHLQFWLQGMQCGFWPQGAQTSMWYELNKGLLFNRFQVVCIWVNKE